MYAVIGAYIFKKQNLRSNMQFSKNAENTIPVSNNLDNKKIHHSVTDQQHTSLSFTKMSIKLYLYLRTKMSDPSIVFISYTVV